MIVNVFIAPCFLDDETVTCHDIVGCLLAVMGTTMACVFGQKKERALSSDELFDCLTSAGFLKYAVVVTVLLAIMRWNIECFKRKWSAAQEKQIISRHSALETTWAHDNLHLLERLPREFCFPFVTKLGPQFYPCVHAVYAGVIGAHSVMFSKIALGFARNAVAHGCCDLVSVASALVAIVPLVFCLVSQLFYLNRALETYRYQLFVAPNYQSAWILTGVVVGMVLYQERDGLSSHAAPLFSFGLLFTLLGLAVVAQRPASPSQVMVTLPATPVSVPLQGVWSANADARSSPTPMSPLFPGTELHAGSFIPADMLPDGQYAGAPPDEATALLPVAARAAAAEERRSPPAPATLRLE